MLSAAFRLFSIGIKGVKRFNDKTTIIFVPLPVENLMQKLELFLEYLRYMMEIEQKKRTLGITMYVIIK